LVPINTSFEVLWKDAHVTPAKDLRKLSQYARAYAAATIDKAIEVQQPLREKYDRIRHLKENLENENQGIVQQ